MAITGLAGDIVLAIICPIILATSPCYTDVQKLTGSCFTNRYLYGSCSSGRCCQLFEFYYQTYCYYNSQPTNGYPYVVNGIYYSNTYYSPLVAGCPSSAVYSSPFCYYGALPATTPGTTTSPTTTTGTASTTSTASPSPSTSTRTTTLSTSPTTSCSYNRVFGLCFRNKTFAYGSLNCPGSVNYGNYSDSSGSVCCQSTQYFYDYDRYCYSGYVGGASTTSPPSCTYIVFGVCYQNRYSHGPCVYDGCCQYGNAYYNWYVYYNDSSTTPNCTYRVINVCYNARTAWGTCAQSRCCALDETYYDGYCYYNGAAGRIAGPDPHSYQLNGVSYKGRTYVGYCDVSTSATECCPYWWMVYNNNHCYDSYFNF